MIRDVHRGSGIPDPDLDFLPIPDPGVKKAQDPGFRSATLLQTFIVSAAFRRHSIFPDIRMESGQTKNE
jgi:hypothetical protein